MSLVIKIVVGIIGALVVIGSICVTIAALFPPKDWKGGELPSKDTKEP